jgi:hypothetical protein
LPCRFTREASSDTPASPPKPSGPPPGFVSTFSTDDTRPPYSAPKPPDSSSARAIASELKTEKRPPRWKGLKIGKPSSSTRFWSAEPPRTL